MALSIVKPFVHVEDSNGLPYVGAKLFVYLPGTTTPAAIYSDAGLSVPLSNPLTGATGSDAAGNFPRAYIAAGSYKLRAETSVGVLIWEDDYIDTGLSAGSGALPIASGGTGGTTATAARTNLDVPSNSELADLASDITDIQSALQNIVSAPQGRLTPTSGTPVISTGVTAGTAVYYTPYLGNLLPIYDGSQFNTVSFAELTLTLNSNHTASNIYDVFVFENSGVVTIGTGPAWNTATAGAGSRGTGAGTTELTRSIGGLYTNAFAMTARNGATTYSVNVNQGTYVGSLFIDGTNGQITCHVVWGASRKFGVWNAYNQVRIALLVGSSTASHTYASATYRPFDNTTANNAQTLCGLPINTITARYDQYGAGSGGAVNFASGIGINSTTAVSGIPGTGQSPQNLNTTTSAAALLAAGIGINTFTLLQAVNSGTATYTGTETNCRMAVEHMA